ncbi:hypothetical protein HYALB_00009640 [Hymenoscyphus albidus]|uniref:Uncharacterized protein n=1 Tax=Hymenoscyphus albidus TaxID=595503 RepID=A0A9N9LNU3_9HELO|nr:hypothetical protein HYALB_00009640 [Hymenoscyphus albidus]
MPMEIYLQRSYRGRIVDAAKWRKGKQGTATKITKEKLFSCSGMRADSDMIFTYHLWTLADNDNGKFERNGTEVLSKISDVDGSGDKKVTFNLDGANNAMPCEIWSMN